MIQRWMDLQLCESDEEARGGDLRQITIDQINAHQLRLND